jgi:hypothetical protein
MACVMVVAVFSMFFLTFILIFLVYMFVLRGILIRRFISKFLQNFKKYSTKSVMAGCVLPKWCYGGERDGIGYFLMSCSEVGTSVMVLYLVVVRDNNDVKEGMYSNSFYSSGKVREYGLGFRPRNIFDGNIYGIVCDGVCYSSGKEIYFFKINVFFKSLICRVINIASFHWLDGGSKAVSYKDSLDKEKV